LELEAVLLLLAEAFAFAVPLVLTAAGWDSCAFSAVFF
jgi:hypothetical protein